MGDVAGQDGHDALVAAGAAVLALDAPVVALTVDGRVLTANAAFQAAARAAFGHPLAIGERAPFEELGADLAEHWAQLLARASAGESFSVTLRSPSAPSLITEHLYTPSRGADGRVSSVLVIERDVTERWASELRTRRTSDRLAIAHRLLQGAAVLDEAAFFQHVVEGAARVTDSEISYFHRVDERAGELTLTAWSRSAMASCRIPDDRHYPIAAAGIWADCVRTHAPVIHNLPPPGGWDVPLGHSELVRHLSVPVLDDGQVRLVVGVGNKATPYDDLDAEQLTLLAGEVWLLVREREATRLLREREENLRTIIDLVPYSVWAKDAEGRILFANRVYAERTGVRPEAIAGRLEREITDHPEMIEHYLTEDREVIKTGRPILNREQALIDRQGRRRAELVSKVPFLPAGATDVAVAGIAVDVTKLREAEGMATVLASLVDRLPEAIVLIEDERVRYVNAAFEQLTGWERHDILDLPAPLLSGPDARTVFERIRRHLETSRTWRGVIELRRRDGSLFDAELSVTVLDPTAAASTRSLVVARDFTAELDAADRLRAADRDDAVARLAAAVAHDLNNLLAAAQGNVELAALEAASDERAQLHLTHAVTSLRRAASTVSRLLQSTDRRTVAQPEEHDMREVVALALDELADEVPPGVVVHLTSSPVPPVARADARVVAGSLRELVRNAAEALRNGGRIDVEVRCVADGAEVVVSDDGPGMTDEVRARAFEPYFTTKPPSEGLGLGLPSVAADMHLQGGTATLESEPGRGTRVTLRFPAQRPVAAVSDPPRSGEVVVLVADANLRAATGSVLRQLGFAAVEVGDVDAALRALPSAEVLLVDGRAPGVAGLRAVRAALPNVPVVLLVPTHRGGVPAEPHDERTVVVASPWRVAELRRALQRAFSLAARP